MTDAVGTAAKAQPTGCVYTFYSYKGGVGRSMALANVGVALALSGHRVLLVDWDLEAPGLEHYFGHAAQIVDAHAERPGIIELLQAHADGTPLPWQDCCRRAEFLGRSLDLIAAGRRSADYRSRVQHLDWKSLYEDHQVGNYVDRLRQEWREAYDFVLVDSRTGISDSGDICTVLLPDVLVLLFVANQQNIDGILSTWARARRVHARLPVDRSRLLAVPVLSRDERDTEYEQSAQWQAKAAEAFADAYGDWLPQGVTAAQALHQLYLPYVAYWSFGERLPLIESERERVDPSSLGFAYTRLATLLAHELDWRALTETMSAASDVESTRQQLLVAQEALRETEEQAEDLRQRAREDLQRAERAQDLLRQQTMRELARVKSRERWRALMLLLVAAVLVLGIWVLMTSRQSQRIPTLSERAVSPDTSVRLQLVSELIGLGPAARTYRADIDRLLRDPEPSLRAQAVRAWASAGLLATDGSATFDSLLSDPDREVLRSAVETVALEGPQAAIFAPRLVMLLTHGDAGVRAAAAHALGMVAPPQGGVAPRLAAVLKDSDPRVRAAAARSLGGLGDAALDHFGAVTALRNDVDPDVRLAASEALARMGEAPTFALLLKDPDPTLRGRAAQVLAGLGEPGHKYAADVAALLRDSDDSVRVRAVDALASMGPAAEPYRSAIVGRLRDRAWTVRLEAVRALGRQAKLSASEAAQLAQSMRDENPVVREAAARVLDRPGR